MVLRASMRWMKDSSWIPPSLFVQSSRSPPCSHARLLHSESFASQQSCHCVYFAEQYADPAAHVAQLHVRVVQYVQYAAKHRLTTKQRGVPFVSAANCRYQHASCNHNVSLCDTNCIQDSRNLVCPYVSHAQHSSYTGEFNTNLHHITSGQLQ